MLTFYLPSNNREHDIPVTPEYLSAMLAVTNDISKALENLGYITKNLNISVAYAKCDVSFPETYSHFVITVNNRRFGIWDESRKTFVV